VQFASPPVLSPGARAREIGNAKVSLIAGPLLARGRDFMPLVRLAMLAAIAAAMALALDPASGWGSDKMGGGGGGMMPRVDTAAARAAAAEAVAAGVRARRDDAEWKAEMRKRGEWENANRLANKIYRSEGYNLERTNERLKRTITKPRSPTGRAQEVDDYVRDLGF
jgi:hypothetical protein